MKAKTLAIALAVLTLTSTSAMAKGHNKECKKSACQATEQTAQPGDNNKMYQPREFTDFAMEGILLDVNQQAKADQLKADLKAKRDAAKAECKENKDNKGRRHCGKEMRDNYIKGMKEILTPDQYTLFLENIVFMPQPDKPAGFGQRGHNMKHAPKAAKLDKKDLKMERAPKGKGMRPSEKKSDK